MFDETFRLYKAEMSDRVCEVLIGKIVERNKKMIIVIDEMVHSPYTGELAKLVLEPLFFPFPFSASSLINSFLSSLEEKRVEKTGENRRNDARQQQKKESHRYAK